jgi:hypothetical protein
MIYLYFSQDKSIALALISLHKKSVWKMIKLDLKTDTFTKGQCLAKKKINPNKCSLNKDGIYFYYTYYDLKKWAFFNIISKIPYFTGEFVVGGESWYCSSKRCHFNENNELIYPYYNEAKASTLIKNNYPFPIKQGQEMERDPNQFLNLMDCNGRKITTIEKKIFANGELLFDFTDEKFECVSPIETSESES